MSFVLYYLVDPRTNNPFYVGYTKNEKLRLGRHIKEVNQLKKHGKCESNNLMKVGTIRQIMETGEKPIFQVLERRDTLEEIKSIEIEHIAKYGLRILNTGILTNMTLGGEGSLGKKKSKEELERRVSTRRKNGEWHSEDTRKSMSNAKMGTKTGKPSWNAGLTKETNTSVAQMAEKRKGIIPWNKK